MSTFLNMNLKLGIVLIALVLFATGCGKDTPSFSLLPDGQSFKQTKGLFNNQLDILFVVDNSGSMQPYQDELGVSFNSFIQNFTQKGFDYKIAVAATNSYLEDPNLAGCNSTCQANYANLNMAKFRSGTTSPAVYTLLPTMPDLINTFNKMVKLGTGGAGDERAFDSFRVSLSSSKNAGFLRPSSFLAIIILSDEDDFSGNERAVNGSGGGYCTYGTTTGGVTCKTRPISYYTDYLDNLTGSSGAFRRYNVSNISALDSSCHEDTSSIVGVRYKQLTQATDGISGSICDDFSPSLNSIQSKISELSTQFHLDRVPQVNTIVITVNGVNIVQDAANGWTYNSAANSIVFHGASIPPQDASINVNFVPETIKN